MMLMFLVLMFLVLMQWLPTVAEKDVALVVVEVVVGGSGGLCGGHDVTKAQEASTIIAAP